MNTDYRPLFPIDLHQKGMDEVARALLEGKQIINPPTVTPADIHDPENWMRLEARMHGTNQQPDLYVSMLRLAATPAIVKAAADVGMQVGNTARDLNNNPYIGSINHPQAMQLIKAAGYLPESLRTFVDVLGDINGALVEGKQIYDARGNPVSATKLQQFWDDVSKVTDPYRAEWLDAVFQKLGKNARFNIAYHRIQPKGILVPVTEPLSPYLAEDKTPGISLENWLRTATEHGLPQTATLAGQLWYWCPQPGAVARFGANSVGALLVCGGSPQDSDPGRGVRPVRAAEV